MLDRACSYAGRSDEPAKPFGCCYEAGRHHSPGSRHALVTPRRRITESHVKHLRLSAMSVNSSGSLSGHCSSSFRNPPRPQWRLPVSHVQRSCGNCQPSSSQPGTARSAAAAAPLCPLLQPRSQQRVGRRRHCRGGALVARASLRDTLVGLGIFFTPSIVAVIYAYFKGKGNVKDGLSRMLTVCPPPVMRCSPPAKASVHVSCC